MMGISEEADQVEGVEWRLEVGDHVRLRNEASNIYVAAHAGAEGWVRKRMVDRMGDFPMVFVEWDRDHWSYNDQIDMWTFEEHFDKIEDDKPVSDTPDKSDVAKALNVLAEAFGLEETSKGEDTEGEKRAALVTPEDFQQFEAVLERAIKIAKDSDAFLIATIEKVDAPEGSGAKFSLVPHIYSYAMSPESAVLLDAQLSEVVSAAHQGLAISEMRRLLDPKRAQDES